MTTTPDVHHPHLYGGWVADAIGHDIDWTNDRLHVIAEAIAPTAPQPNSVAAKFLSDLRDAALDVIAEYDNPDTFRRDVLDGTLIASVDVWQAWTDLRLWQDQACAVVLAAADTNMVAAGSLDITDVARLAVRMVGNRLVDSLWEQHHQD